MVGAAFSAPLVLYLRPQASVRPLCPQALEGGLQGRGPGDRPSRPHRQGTPSGFLQPTERALPSLHTGRRAKPLLRTADPLPALGKEGSTRGLHSGSQGPVLSVHAEKMHSNVLEPVVGKPPMCIPRVQHPSQTWCSSQTSLLEAETEPRAEEGATVGSTIPGLDTRYLHSDLALCWGVAISVTGELLTCQDDGTSPTKCWSG